MCYGPIGPPTNLLNTLTGARVLPECYLHTGLWPPQWRERPRTCLGSVKRLLAHEHGPSREMGNRTLYLSQGVCHGTLRMHRRPVLARLAYVTGWAFQLRNVLVNPAYPPALN